MKKKASLLDNFFLVIILLVSATTIILVFTMFSKINDKIQESPDISIQGKEIMQNGNNKFVGLFDGLFLVVFVTMAIAAIIFASQINTSPLFFPLAIIMYILLIIVSAIVGNVFYKIVADPTLNPYALEFTIIPFFFNNIVKIMLGLAILMGIVMYARQQQ